MRRRHREAGTESEERKMLALRELLNAYARYLEGKSDYSEFQRRVTEASQVPTPDRAVRQREPQPS